MIFIIEHLKFFIELLKGNNIKAILSVLIGLVAFYRYNNIIISFIYMIFSYLIINLFSLLWDGKFQWQQRRRNKKYLKKLTKQEKDILSCFIKNSTKTYTLPIDNGTLDSLIRMGLVSRASSIKSERFCSPVADYNIESWVYNYLKDNKNLLD